jgi:arginase family enzyme
VKSGQTSAIFFPFDLFGSGGTGDGATLLGEAFEEMLADNRRETVPTRAAAYQGRVRTRHLSFETVAAYQDWRKRGRQLVRRAWSRGDFLLWVAGNHLGVLPVYEELAAGRLSGSAESLVVQFDSHLDIQQFADCTTELSHGNFLLHCAEPLPSIINVGHRDLLLPPAHTKQYYQAAWPAQAVAADPDGILQHLRQAVQAADRVFLDIDCDVFDPAFFPAVAHPSPYGIAPSMLLRLLDACWSDRIAGISLSEFSPSYDRDDQSLSTLVWLVEFLLLKYYESSERSLSDQPGLLS